MINSPRKWSGSRMANRYLNKFSDYEYTDTDRQIKSHLEKAKREVVSALRIIANSRRTNILYRVASRRTELELQGVLSLIDKISVVKPLPKEEKAITPKEKRLLRRNRGKVSSTKEVGNGRRNRR